MNTTNTSISDDKIIHKYFVKDKKKGFMIKSTTNKLLSIDERNYILNRFTDSDSLHESLQRIFFCIENKPKCPICGNPVKWIGKKNKLMTKTCSNKDCFGKFRYEESKKTNFKKYGVENCFQSEEKKQKMRQTWINKYGVDNPNKSGLIRKKSEQTCLFKYGVHNGGGSQQALEKIKKTNFEKRGVTCPFQDKEVQGKIRETCINKYGTPYPAKLEEIKEKTRQTNLKRYGAEWYFQSDIYRKDLDIYLEKIRNTKKKNHTFTYSKSENIIYNKLSHYFDKIICQFYDEKRYPFNCDFYIPEIDTFIEYQGYFSHSDHPFDEKNSEDIYKLNEYKNLLNNGKSYYKCVINTWAGSDVEKRNIAKTNNLNYIEFWNFEEVDNWLENYDKKY